MENVEHLRTGSLGSDQCFAEAKTAVVYIFEKIIELKKNGVIS